MRKMRDSGIAWIGVIPQDWEIVRTKSLYCSAKEIAGDRADDFERLALTLNGVIKRSKEDSVGLQPEKFSGYQILKKGELVFKLIDLENVATSRVGLSPYTGIVSPAYIVLSKQSRAKDLVVRYSMYHFLSMWQREIFNQMGDNGVRSSLNAKDLLNIPHPFPSIYEQKRIVTFLDAQCAEIDTVLEKTRASIEEYKKLKQAVITQAVTKGIRGDRPMKDSGIEWIGDIPAEWSVVPFSKFARVSTNLVNPSDYQDYLQVSPENIEKDSGKLLPCKTVSEVGVESWNHFFHKGQILYSKIRPKLNKVCIAPFDGLCSADMYPIDTDNISKFVVYTILSNDFNQQVAMITENRVKMPKINQKELSKIIVVLPANRMEQQEIVDYLDGECEKIDALIAKKQQYLTEIENYKKSLIYEYVTGKKEVV